MTFSLILLGVLLILVSFDIGQSVYKKININKKNIIILIIISIFLYFMPHIKIRGVSFTWVGFILPIIFSICILTKVKNIKKYFKLFVCVLISFSLNIIYNLITFDVYESAIFQPYIALAIALGSFLLILAKTPQNVYATNFLGLIFAEIIFYFSRYSIYGEYYLTLGSLKVFEMLVVGFVSSLLSFYAIRKAKAKLLKRKIDQKKREQYLA